MTHTPDGLSRPAERRDTPAMQEPADRGAQGGVAGHRPPAHAGDTWIAAQLREAIHRVSAALDGSAEDVDPPLLEHGRDLEPEP